MCILKGHMQFQETLISGDHRQERPWLQIFPQVQG